jgi:hypothetical protein
MPHHRHPVAAKDEALNIGEVECAFRRFSRMSIGQGGLVLTSPEDTAE